MASTPPPFEQSYAPAPKRGTSPWVWIVVAVVGFCCVGVIAMGFLFNSLFNQGGAIVGCMMTASMANESMIKYAKEHDGRLPSASTWQDDITPYYIALLEEKKKEMGGQGYLWDKFKPADIGSDLTCNAGEPKTGFALNADIAGKKLDEIGDKEATISIFEVPEIGRNQTMKFVPRKKDTGPRMFGERRSWLNWKLEGMQDPMKGGKNDPFAYEEVGNEPTTEAPPAPAK